MAWDPGNVADCILHRGKSRMVGWTDCSSAASTSPEHRKYLQSLHWIEYSMHMLRAIVAYHLCPSMSSAGLPRPSSECGAPRCRHSALDRWKMAGFLFSETLLYDLDLRSGESEGCAALVPTDRLSSQDVHCYLDIALRDLPSGRWCYLATRSDSSDRCP